jgi:hypothetical protein
MSLPENAVKFLSGAVRGTDSSDFIADTPFLLLQALAQAFEDGKAKGYPHGNWKKGFPVRNLISHLLAHILKYSEGDASEDHLAHAVFNLTCLLCQRSDPARYGKLDDRLIQPAYVGYDPGSGTDVQIHMTCHTEQAEQGLERIIEVVDKAQAEQRVKETFDALISTCAQRPLKAPETGTGSVFPTHFTYKEAEDFRAISNLVYLAPDTVEEYDADHISFWLSDRICRPEGIRCYAYKKVRNGYALDFQIFVEPKDLLPDSAPITFYA